MVRTLLVTVRIRRSSGPPRVRAFVVQIPRRSGERAEPDLRAAVALVLTLLRSQRRARQPHPGRAGITCEVILKCTDCMKSPVFSKYLKTEHMTSID
ncbi:PREDICTED: tumor suppressor ARF-like [Miniopterus natalensis]|uniref:tumor suppressor ARF-like n=1 Tax=Miniopterus natalensis TaxID=291302 RepID=UPI0007A6F972|nr:PREDICTED: tumor suppressor ARF-like [Miniopterus natalensis]